MTTAPPPEAPPADPPNTLLFLGTLQNINKGSTVAELADAMQALTRAVSETGRKGSLTLTLTVAPATKNVLDTLIVSPKITLKTPEPEQRVSIFYPDEQGRLFREPPAQPKLDGLRVVEEPAQGELRQVDGKSAAAGER